MATAVSMRQYREQSIKTPCTKRIFELALPKQSKRIWLTDYGPRVLWGNQDTIRPMKRATLRYEASERTRRLATPKPNHKQEFSFVRTPERNCWTANSTSRRPPLTPEKMDDQAARAAYFKRVAFFKKMSKPKPIHPNFRPNISSTVPEAQIYPVRKGALNYDPTPRLLQLSQGRVRSAEFLVNREQGMVVTPGAKRYEPTERVLQLASPRSRPNVVYMPTAPEEPITAINPKVAKSKPSPRILEMSRPRGYTDGYEDNRSSYWPVSGPAQNTSATPRIEQLATPHVRELTQVLTLDLDSFRVKPLAIKGRCSERVAVLAKHIER